MSRIELERGGSVTVMDAGGDRISLKVVELQGHATAEVILSAEEARRLRFALALLLPVSPFPQQEYPDRAALDFRPYWIKAGNIYTCGTMWFRSDLPLTDAEVNEIFASKFKTPALSYAELLEATVEKYKPLSSCLDNVGPIMYHISPPVDDDDIAIDADEVEEIEDWYEWALDRYAEVFDGLRFD